MKSNLNHLINPKSIAVIGVSSDSSKVGAVVFNNIIDSGFGGQVYPINPKYSSLFGHKCYRKVSDIEAPVDLVIFAIPAEFVLSELKEIVESKTIKSICVISAGFKEIGESGIILENELVYICKSHDIRLLGPNCLGFINTRLNLNASFAATSSPVGDSFVLSQSGAICTALIDAAIEKHFGFSHLVSYGNKADVNEIDLINFALEQKDIKSVSAYIEEISDGYELYKLLKTNDSKSVIILNPGQTTFAQSAIASHTGSLVRSGAITTQALSQAGAIMVDSFENFFNLTIWFGWQKNKVKGSKIAIVTNAGGMGIIATDHVANASIDLVTISEKNQIELKKVLPPSANVHNPIDLIGDAPASRYRDVLKILESEEIDIILLILTPQRVTQIEETAKIIIDHQKFSTKAIVPVFIGGEYVRTGIKRFLEHQIPCFEYVEDAIDTLKYVIKYNLIQENKTKYFADLDRILELDIKKNPEIKISTQSSPVVLDEDGVTKLLSNFNIDCPAQIITSDIEEIKRFHKQYSPIVLKATSKELMHKTEHHAVYLDLKSDDAIENAFNQLQKMLHSVGNSKNKDFLFELIVQEQIGKGEEIFVGIKRDGSSKVYSNKEDKGFGHVVVFGKGGIYTELYKDVASRLLPLTKAGIADLINEPKIAKILNGFRGQKPYAINQLVSLIANLQDMVFAYPEISDIDINPVIMSGSRAIAADVKIVVSN